MSERFYPMQIGDLHRELPVVKISPTISVASFNLLGDVELVNVSAAILCQKIDHLKADCLVGPEVKVVPLIHAMANILGHERYVIARKNIMAYMSRPLTTRNKPGLVLDGRDADYLNTKRVIIVDDVISTGSTLQVIQDLMLQVGAKVVGTCAIFKQGDKEGDNLDNLIFLTQLPVFTS